MRGEDKYPGHSLGRWIDSWHDLGQSRGLPTGGEGRWQLAERAGGEA